MCVWSLSSFAQRPPAKRILANLHHITVATRSWQMLSTCPGKRPLAVACNNPNICTWTDIKPSISQRIHQAQAIHIKRRCRRRVFSVVHSLIKLETELISQIQCQQPVCKGKHQPTDYMIAISNTGILHAKQSTVPMRL